MDRHNLRELQALRPEDYEGHLGLLLALRDPPLPHDVPDPYYGGTQEFETALDLIEQGADALLLAVRQRLARPA
jgi:protein-tyrosine phosphatase